MGVGGGRWENGIEVGERIFIFYYFIIFKFLDYMNVLFV